MTQPSPLKDMSFEAALAELEQVVRSLESGQIPLEDSIKAYERGVELRRLCEQCLKDAQLKVDKLVLTAEGAPTGTEPFAEK